MDPRYLPRISMSGWVILTFFVIAHFESNGMVDSLSQFNGFIERHSSNVTIRVTTVLLAVLFGAPAIGFLLERIAFRFSVFIRGRYDALNQKDLNQYLEPYIKSHMSKNDQITPAGLFHVIMYQKDNDKFSDFLSRRRTRIMVACSTILSVWIGILLHFCTSHSSFPPVATISFAFVISGLYILQGRHENRVHDESVRAWLSLLCEDANRVDDVAHKTITFSRLGTMADEETSSH